MRPFLVHLMRHGAPETPGLLLGKTDAPATAEGIADCVAKTEGLGFGALIASDLQRSARAAQAIADQRGVPVALDPRWRELDFGTWDGLAPEQVESKALAAFWKDPDTAPPPGGECWSTFIGRIEAALAAIPARDTLVVTHGGAIRAALACLFDFEQRHLWAFALPYAAVVSLQMWPGTPRPAQIAGLRS